MYIISKLPLFLQLLTYISHIMTKILTFAGWGQDDEAFASHFEGATPVYYMQQSSYQDIAVAQADIVVGWSLGGQVALRLVSEAVLTPKLLVLLAAPFQFVEDNAESRQQFEDFSTMFAAKPEATLKRFQLMVAQGDELAKEVRKQLVIQSKRQYLSYWLAELGAFSCKNIAWENVPQTLLMHGENDTVVNFHQAEQLAKLLPQSHVVKMVGCGHAPHLHNGKLVTAIIKEKFSA